MDTFSKAEGGVVAFFFSRHTNVRVHVFLTGMLICSPVEVATIRRLGAGCFPLLELVLARLLLGGLKPNSLLCSSTTGNPAAAGATGAAGAIGATCDDP